MSEELFGPALRAHLQRQDGAPGEAADSAADTDRRLAALAEREQELGELQYRLAEAAAKLRAEEAELAAREGELARREAAFADTNRRPVREVLRERAELFADRLWSVFDEALEATQPDGHPDYAARVAALQVLLSEAYTTPSTAEHAAGDADGSYDVPEPVR